MSLSAVWGASFHLHVILYIFSRCGRLASCNANPTIMYNRSKLLINALDLVMCTIAQRLQMQRGKLQMQQAERLLEGGDHYAPEQI